MNDLQRFLADDHIQGLRHEAAALRAERARDRDRVAHRAGASSTVATTTPDADDVTGHALDAAVVAGAPIAVTAAALQAIESADPAGSPRIRLGRWLVGVGTAIAGPELLSTTVSPIPAAAAAGAVAAAGTACTGPCGDDHPPLSHAA